MSNMEKKNLELIDRNGLKADIEHIDWNKLARDGTLDDGINEVLHAIDEAQVVNAIEVTPDYKPGDVCIYSFDNGNKSCSIVEIVKILDDERGAAEVKFLKVFADDSGNGWFNYLFKTNQTMNASFKYLKNITPR